MSLLTDPGKDKCWDCGRVFDLYSPDDFNEWDAGHPSCDPRDEYDADEKVGS